MKLKFVKDAYYNGERKYLMGEIYEISDELGEATRWLKRGLAEEFKEVVLKKEETKIELVEEVKELEVQMPIEYESVVKEEAKKENGRVKRRKGSLLNENPKVL